MLQSGNKLGEIMVSLILPVDLLDAQDATFFTFL
jgi:hypothetical protein